MNLRTFLVTLGTLAVSASLLFLFVHSRLPNAWFAFGVHPEVMALIDSSMEDQRRLATLDPAAEDEYRRRFEEIRTLSSRLRVLAYSRAEITRRYELILAAVVAGAVALSASGYLWRQARQSRRLDRLREALADLAAGASDIELGETRRDLIGRIAAMVEQTSRMVGRDRRRLASLENLSAWQEAARRHAHEIRTPLTAARLELERLPEAATPEARRTLQRALGEELDRLAAFTRGFTSFARQPQPELERRDLGRLVAELVELFAEAWPELEMQFEPPPNPVEVMVDAEMVRQVLVNLADNSASALREAGRRQGRLELSISELENMVALDVTDDGPGVPPDIRRRLFEPYTTSRRVGEGMGLGLAISRKFLLDHGGDLELARTSGSGTTFRLLLPRPGASSEVLA